MFVGTLLGNTDVGGAVDPVNVSLMGWVSGMAETEGVVVGAGV
jgi:hypothetical protein